MAQQDYETFVEKFKSKKTTDDCYTPPRIYEIVKNWVVKEYNLENRNILRPFYPGGDYERVDYGDNDVVIDNPPFSILSKIINFYISKNIKFFLFATPSSVFNAINKSGVCGVIVNSNIVFENGAVVPIGFLTNLDTAILRTAPDLFYKLEEEVQKTRQRKFVQLPKYKYPKNVLGCRALDKFRKIELKIYPHQTRFVRALEQQKKLKKGMYGSGVFISDYLAKELEAKELEAKELEAKEYIWELSEDEKEIIKELNRKEEEYGNIIRCTSRTKST